jgi:hypothetical protein
VGEGSRLGTEKERQPAGKRVETVRVPRQGSEELVPRRGSRSFGVEALIRQQGKRVRGPAKWERELPRLRVRARKREGGRDWSVGVGVRKEAGWEKATVG